MFGQNHEVRIHTLEEKVDFLMRRELDLENLRSETRENTAFVVEDQNDLRAQLQELSQKYDSLAELQHRTEMKRQAQSHAIQELQHAINNSDKRISQLFQVIGELIDQRRQTDAIIQNIESVYVNTDKRIGTLGFAVSQHDVDIAALVDFKNALSTTGIVMKVANVAAVNDDEDILE